MVLAGFLMPMARHFKILSNVNPLQWITCSVVIEFENLKTKKNSKSPAFCIIDEIPGVEEWVSLGFCYILNGNRIYSGLFDKQR